MLAMVQDDWPSIEYIIGPGAGMGRDAPAAAVEQLPGHGADTSFLAVEVVES